MSTRSRRTFLKTTAAAGAATALTHGAAHGQDAEPKMAIARWKGAAVDDAGVPAMARTMTQKVVAELGGMGRFVKKGDVVWVKPNMAWDRTPEQAGNTNPEVVATLVKMAYEAGAKHVKVGDRTCSKAALSYPKSGIEAAAKAAGAEVVYIDDNRFKDYPIDGMHLKKWPVYPEIVESDVVINVPIVKHHCLATMTVCMKNYMGVVGGKRGQWHQQMGACLADITKFMKPTLCVVDAIRILTANGPSGGNLNDVKRMDTMAAGTDIVALDAFGAELLGHKPADIESVVAGAKSGLGEMDYRKLNPRELELA